MPARRRRGQWRSAPLYVAVARAIVIASNDDHANLEVALDARRMNPGIGVVRRLFDQQVATKIKPAFTVDEVFSVSALAASHGTPA
jgi:voltage-gated potassium channel